MAHTYTETEDAITRLRAVYVEYADIDFVGADPMDDVKILLAEYDRLRAIAQTAPIITDEAIETACAAYAKATGYYVEFHRGLSSESSDRMRAGMRAAMSALSSTERK
jgi:hypothetical protein